jgi:hypothetical protein
MMGGGGNFTKQVVMKLENTIKIKSFVILSHTLRLFLVWYSEIH